MATLVLIITNHFMSNEGATLGYKLSTLWSAIDNSGIWTWQSCLYAADGMLIVTMMN